MNCSIRREQLNYQNDLFSIILPQSTNNILSNLPILVAFNDDFFDIFGKISWRFRHIRGVIKVKVVIAWILLAAILDFCFWNGEPLIITIQILHNYFLNSCLWLQLTIKFWSFFNVEHKYCTLHIVINEIKYCFG